MNKIIDLLARINSKFSSSVGEVHSDEEKVYNEAFTLKGYIENTQAGKLIKIIDTTNAERPIRCYMHELSNWTGIGNCSHFNFYTHNEILIGVEIFFIPPLDNCQILKIYPEYELMSSLEFDDIGFDAINFTYATYKSDVLLALTTEKKQPNRTVMFSIFKFDYSIEY